MTIVATLKLGNAAVVIARSLWPPKRAFFLPCDLHRGCDRRHNRDQAISSLPTERSLLTVDRSLSEKRKAAPQRGVPSGFQCTATTIRHPVASLKASCANSARTLRRQNRSIGLKWCGPVLTGNDGCRLCRPVSWQALRKLPTATRRLRRINAGSDGSSDSLRRCGPPIAGSL